MITCASVAFFACAKTGAPVDTQKGVSLNVTAETTRTKAVLQDNTTNVSHLWESGDQIGVYVNEWNDRNATFTLVGSGGESSGVFSNSEVTASNTFKGAFYPKGNGNNLYVDSGTAYVYFHMLDTYENYKSGQSFVPMYDALGDTHNKDIQLKHAGGAIILTMENLPPFVKSVGISSGITVYEHNHVSVSTARTTPVVMTKNDGSSSLSGIWLHINDSDWNSSFEFVFPVTTLSDAVLIFTMYDATTSGSKVWEKTTKKTSVSRANAVVFSADFSDIFTTTKSDYSLIGSAIGGWDKSNSIDLYEITGTSWYYRSNVSFTKDSFKIWTNYSWGTDGKGGYGTSAAISTGASSNRLYQNGANCTMDTAGTYDVYFKPDGDNSQIYFVKKEVS